MTKQNSSAGKTKKKATALKEKAVSKPTALKKAAAALLIASNRHITNLALIILSPYRKCKEITITKNIAYDETDKFCKYDIFMPQTALENAQKVPTVFYFHGGSFCGGDKYGYGNFCQKLAKLGYLVVNVNYRLVPKVLLTDCIDDCKRAISHAVKTMPEIDAEQVFLAGDSAGATIAIKIAIDNDVPVTLKGLGLYYGVYNLSAVKGVFKRYLQALYNYSYSDFPHEKFLEDCEILSHIKAPFVPCFITSGKADSLHNQSVALNKCLTEKKIKHRTLFFKKALDSHHGFLNASRLYTSREAFKALTEFFEELLVKTK